MWRTMGGGSGAGESVWGPGQACGEGLMLLLFPVPRVTGGSYGCGMMSLGRCLDDLGSGWYLLPLGVPRRDYVDFLNNFPLSSLSSVRTSRPWPAVLSAGKGIL
ncbi:hypothetical protein DL98DRAFT_129648 [Cadophora sp. DSE1049]|nr:hypothetical protein DL98DRAFT_129648 [Cadophora sp. DSE1049]